MIRFSFVSVEGFGSFIDPFTYYLDRVGINLITGKNGAGKTTIFSALSWCLYGQPLKEKCEVEPWEDIRPKHFKGTRVNVQFIVGNLNVNIFRHKDYSGKTVDKKAGGSRLLLYINGDLQPLKDKRETQAKIVELLGMSFNLFKNSIAFGQNLTRLLRESGPKQKEIFDEAFDVTYINKARDKASKFYMDLKDQDSQLSHEAHELQEVIKQIEETRKAYETQKEETQEAIREVKKDLKENLEKVRALGDPKEVEESDKELQSCEEYLDTLTSKHFKLDFTHEQEKAQTKALKQQCSEMAIKLTQRVPVCDRCGQAIKEAEAFKARLKEELKQKRTEWTARVKEDEKREEELASLASSIEKVKKKRKILKERQKALEQEKINAKLRQELISARPKLEARLKTLEATLERANKSLTTNDASELIKKKEAIEEKHFRIEKQLKLHKWLIDDPLSNKGLKAFIFQALLQNVNEQLKKYGKYLGYYIEFSIDLESGNKNFEAVVYSNDQIRMYEDLSGGQKQLVDVCLAFAIHDTITETKDLNILLMDEVFESLDADNIELVSELIQHKAKDTSIHLISHQSSLVFSKVSRITHFKLVNGITAVQQ